MFLSSVLWDQSRVWFPRSLWIFYSTDKALYHLQHVSCRHKVGTLAWFLKGCSGTTRSDLSQLPRPMYSALFRGFLGPALECVSHVAEKSQSSARPFASVSLRCSVAPFSVLDHVEGHSHWPWFGYFWEFRSCPEYLVFFHYSASFRDLWGETKFCLEKSTLLNNDSNSNNNSSAFYQL